MKSLGCLVLLCLFHSSLNAQHGFDPGYIINHNRDTVKGFIETTEEKSLSGSVHFKKEMNGEIKEYNPKDLFGFGINQELYRRIRFSNTIEGNKMDTVFARQLVAGAYNLFTIVTSARFFLLQKDTSIFLLYDESQDGVGAVDRVGNFRNYLNFISIACDQFKDRYKQVGYGQGRLRAVCKRRNEI